MGRSRAHLTRGVRHDGGGRCTWIATPGQAVIEHSAGGTGVDDQRDDPTSPARISSMRSEMSAQYANLPLRTVDASVIAAAERLGTNDIATLDRRHFTVVQSNIGVLNLLP